MHIDCIPDNHGIGQQIQTGGLIRLAFLIFLGDHAFTGKKEEFPQIMQLSDRDINSLKGIIDTARKHKDHNMAFMAAEKIKAHLKIDTYLEPEEFLEVLLKDYNYLSAN